jgi:hypothetical protein
MMEDQNVHVHAVELVSIKHQSLLSFVDIFYKMIIFFIAYWKASEHHDLYTAQM